MVNIIIGINYEIISCLSVIHTSTQSYRQIDISYRHCLAESATIQRDRYTNIPKDSVDKAVPCIQN